jgi:uncharacterized protein (DUF2225 family)
MAHVRLRNRETPKSEIECQIGETVNPKKVCPKCAYATGCSDYENYLSERHRRHQVLTKIKLELQYRYWQLRVWLDNYKLRYWNYE